MPSVSGGGVQVEGGGVDAGALLKASDLLVLLSTWFRSVIYR